MRNADFDTEAHTRRMVRDGYTVIDDFLGAHVLDQVREGLKPLLGAHVGRNDFEGYLTERVYTLVARGRVFEDITEDPRVLALLDRFLLPGYLLTASQAICIQPGEDAQGVHVDDSFYRLPRPRPPVSISLIAAIDNFTLENGATEIIAGSQTWSDAEVAALTPERAKALLQPMTLKAGSAIVFQATMLHQGGANNSPVPRLALTNQYCQPWGRTQENYFLGVPREMAREMSPRLQALLGYGVWSTFMGHVSASHPAKALDAAWVAPVLNQVQP